MIYTGVCINFMIKYKTGILKIAHRECGYLSIELWLKYFAYIGYVQCLHYMNIKNNFSNTEKLYRTSLLENLAMLVTHINHYS